MWDRYLRYYYWFAVHLQFIHCVVSLRKTLRHTKFLAPLPGSLQATFEFDKISRLRYFEFFIWIFQFYSLLVFYICVPFLFLSQNSWCMTRSQNSEVVTPIQDIDRLERELRKPRRQQLMAELRNQDQGDLDDYHAVANDAENCKSLAWIVTMSIDTVHVCRST